MDPMVRRSCPIVSNRQWLIRHDWENDEIVKRINSLPADVTLVDDIFMKDHNRFYMPE